MHFSELTTYNWQGQYMDGKHCAGQINARDIFTAKEKIHHQGILFITLMIAIIYQLDRKSSTFLTLLERMYCKLPLFDRLYRLVIPILV